MKKIYFLQMIIIILFSKAALAEGIIISQVLYDPLNSESGGEAVELFNPGSSSVDISGWVIATETSSTDATIPDGARISANGYYLVADSGWSIERDDLNWPQADHEEIITLTNTDAGVALSNGSIIIDAVGWGDAASIDVGLFEGVPHSGTSAGEGLVRLYNGSYVDTNNNFNDFQSKINDFHNASLASFSGSHLLVTAIIGGSFPVIDAFTITTDDLSLPGVQISPVPKINKTVDFTATITHPNGIEYLDTVNVLLGATSYPLIKAADLSLTTSEFVGSLNMSPNDAAGNYSLTLIATDLGGLSSNSSEYFEYMTLLAIELDSDSLTFAALPGSASELSGDVDPGTNNLTIQNIGNAVVNIQLSGTNLSSATGVIGVENIAYTFNGDYNNSMAGILSYSKQTSTLDMEAASRLPLSFKLTVPSATAPGNYTGTITLVAVE